MVMISRSEVKLVFSVTKYYFKRGLLCATLSQARMLQRSSCVSHSYRECARVGKDKRKSTYSGLDSLPSGLSARKSFIA